ncbi:MAG: cell envelope integrity protein TolA [Burkholderiaceae bacterium]
MSLASDRPEFTPPPAPGRLRAIGFAILAHVLLIAALTWGVSWKRESSSSPIQAELWSAIPQDAAPALVEPVAPPPPPPPPEPVRKLPQAAVQPPKAAEPPPEPVIDPQIAIEKEKKKKLEKKKALADATAVAKAKAKAKAEKEAEAEAERQAALDKKKQLDAKKAEAKKLEAKKAADELAKKTAADKKTKEALAAKEEAALKSGRDAQLKRMAGLAGATGGESATGTAKQSSGPSAGYGGRVIAKIKPNIVFTDDIAGNPVATVEVRTSPDGTIIGRKLIKSSGLKAWDDAVLRAIDKTEILPRDLDGRVPSSFEINFRPKD